MFSLTDPWKSACDCIVGYGVMICIIDPIMAIFNGDLWGSGAFLAGAIVVSASMFGEMYFREANE